MCERRPPPKQAVSLYEDSVFGPGKSRQTALLRLFQEWERRAIPGLRRSIIDLGKVIHDGGVLPVSTSRGTVRRDVAAPVGASLDLGIHAFVLELSESANQC